MTLYNGSTAACAHKLIWSPPSLGCCCTCDLDVHVSVQQQVLRFQVPVDDGAVVTVLHRRQDLPELPSCLQLTQATVLCQVVCSQTGNNMSHLRRKRTISNVRGPFYCFVLARVADSSLRVVTLGALSPSACLWTSMTRGWEWGMHFSTTSEEEMIRNEVLHPHPHPHHTRHLKPLSPFFFFIVHQLLSTGRFTEPAIIIIDFFLAARWTL